MIILGYFGHTHSHSLKHFDDKEFNFLAPFIFVLDTQTAFQQKCSCVGFLVCWHWNIGSAQIIAVLEFEFLKSFKMANHHEIIMCGLILLGLFGESLSMLLVWIRQIILNSSIFCSLAWCQTFEYMHLLHYQFFLNEHYN